MQQRMPAETESTFMLKMTRQSNSGLVKYAESLYLREALDNDDFLLDEQKTTPLNNHSVENDHIEILLRLNKADGSLTLAGALKT